MTQQLQKIMASFAKYPPRAVQSDTYAGPMSITRFCTLQEAKALMKQKRIELPELNQADLQRACRTPAVLLERVTRLAGGHRAGQ